MKLVPLLTLLPVLVVSVSRPVLLTTGTGTVRLVADWLTKFVASVPVPKRTPVTVLRPVPVRVTLVPASPLAGAKLAMVWARPLNGSSNGRPNVSSQARPRKQREGTRERVRNERINVEKKVTKQKHPAATDVAGATVPDCCTVWPTTAAYAGPAGGT